MGAREIIAVQFHSQARDPTAEPATNQTNMKDITLTEVPKKCARSNIVGPFMASTIPCEVKLQSVAFLPGLAAY